MNAMGSSILAKIISHKIEEVEMMNIHFDPGELAHSQRSLKKSIRNNRPGFILECKSASPSKGVIVKNYDPVQRAKIYASFACAISVLTDQRFFKGEYSHLQQVANAVDLPVLCKDFIISEKQIYLARYYGADAILLMLSVLTDHEYQYLAYIASGLGLDVLTEIHNEDELERALSMKAEIIGVNNRNLKTLKIDLHQSQKLLPKVPDNVIAISESGIQCYEDIYSLSHLQRPADGFLIGSHLGQSEQISDTVKKLLRPQIKICGLTNLEDAKLACQLGADYGGLIFAQSSPRFVTEKQVLNLVNQVQMNWVGVFTTLDIEQMIHLQKTLNLDVIQCHFDISQNDIHRLRTKLPERCQIWTLIRVDGESINLELKKNVDRILFEPKGKYEGGNGISFNWKKAFSKFPKDREHKQVLAGGIGPENILDALNSGAGIIDINSKIETVPGKKNRKLMQQLFEKIQLFKELREEKN